EVLEESRLELVHADAARRVWRVDARDPVDDAALPDRVDDLIRDVRHGQAAARPQLLDVLEDLHRRTLLVSSRSGRLVFLRSGAGFALLSCGGGRLATSSAPADRDERGKRS